jgi:drug/metabolite transporter (DMT)-like permease
MMMFALLLASVVCDVAGQICFKLGVGHHDDVSAHGFFGGALHTLRSPWIAALSLAPLSLAFPFAALSYCGVVIASRYILHERVSARRWFGTVAIAAGVALICWA